MPQTILAYTATNQLFFAMTPTGSTGVYDYNWHWYDAAGRRVITHVQNGSTWIPANGASPDSGTRNFYVYDGDDVTLTFVKQGTAWWVRARYLTGGLDDQVAGRFKGSQGLAAENLTLVSDHSGTTLAALKFDGSQELTVPVYSKNPWGMTDLFSLTAGQVNVETGFTGASQPNQTGGFVYLRNRWYDPKTGRFLTQDPIGLAGGVNLYAYAGNDPVSLSDPFGLCNPHKDPDCRPLFAFAVGRMTVIVYSDFSQDERSGGTVAWRNNNRGNIEDNIEKGRNFGRNHGAIGESQGKAVFPDAQTGENAQAALLNTAAYQSRTIDEVIERYAPKEDHNNTAAYQRFVRRFVGVRGNVRLSALNAKQKQKLIRAIRQYEGWREGTVIHTEANR